MPRAVIGQDFGPLENYVLEEFDPGPPGEDEVRIAIKVAGISYVDVLTALGRYQFKPPLPFIPGSEYSGIVQAVGAKVTGIAPGDQVYGSGLGGIFSEVNNFPAHNIGLIPEGMSLETAAVFPVNYMTALYALADRGRAKPGETLLVIGAAGGTGIAAIQVGKHLGLKVIASASNEEKRQAARAAGADAVVSTGSADWRDRVKSANGGQPIDIVFDPVGGDATELAFRTLGYDGRHLVIGFPAGIASLRTNLPLLKNASLVGVQIRDFAIKRPADAEANRKQVIELAKLGVVNPTIARRYPIEEYFAGMREAFSGEAAGRIILTMA